MQIQRDKPPIEKLTRNDYMKMSYADLIKRFRENPDERAAIGPILRRIQTKVEEQIGPDNRWHKRLKWINIIYILILLGLAAIYIFV